MRRAKGPVRKAAEEDALIAKPYPVTSNVKELLESYLAEPSPVGRLILADAMEESGHPHAQVMRDTDLLGNYREQWFRHRYPSPNPGRHGIDFRTFPPHTHKNMIEDMEKGPERTMTSGYEIPDSNSKAFLTDLVHNSHKYHTRIATPDDPPAPRPRPGSAIARYVARRQWAETGDGPEQFSRIQKARATNGRIIVPTQHEIGNIGEWLPYRLLPHELEFIMRAQKGTLERQYATLTPIADLIHNAWAGKVGRQWYDEKGGIHHALTSHSQDAHNDLYREVGLASAMSPNGAFAKAERATQAAMRAWHNGGVLSTGEVVPPRSRDKNAVARLLNGLFFAGDVRYLKSHPLHGGQPMSRRINSPEPDARVEFKTVGGWVPLGGMTYSNVHIPLAAEVLTNPQSLMRKQPHVFPSKKAEKVNNYFHNQIAALAKNTLGHKEFVTGDTHHLNALGITEDTGAPYHLASGITRHAAALSTSPDYNPEPDHPSLAVGVPPADFQAMIWTSRLGAHRAAVLKKDLTGQMGYEAANPSRILLGDENYAGNPGWMSLIKDRVLEGSLPPDVFDKLERNRLRFKPAQADLDAPMTTDPDTNWNLTMTGQKMITDSKPQTAAIKAEVNAKPKKRQLYA